MGPSVPYTVVFLWVSGAAATALGGAGLPNPAQLDAIYDYGAARGVTLSALSGQPGSRAGGSVAYDAERVDRLESELEQARTALSALEEQTAAERLGRIEAELLAHPHLPQAGFLMAECLTLKAQAAGGGAAAELRLRSRVLEGPRAPAFGEALAGAGVVVKAPALVSVVGPAATDVLEVDGEARGLLRQLSLAAGLHHVRVLRGGQPVFATFAELAPTQAELALAVPKARACSADDLSSVDRTLAAQGVPLAAPVQCTRWALVRAEPGGVGIANCNRTGCGPFVHWQRRSAPAPFTPLAIDRSRLPSWAGFAIAGAGAALATGLVLWQSGALDRGHGAAATLEYGGLNP